MFFALFHLYLLIKLSVSSWFSILFYSILWFLEIKKPQFPSSVFTISISLVPCYSYRVNGNILSIFYIGFFNNFSFFLLWYSGWITSWESLFINSKTGCTRIFLLTRSSGFHLLNCSTPTRASSESFCGAEVLFWYSCRFLAIQILKISMQRSWQLNVSPHERRLASHSQNSMTAGTR